MTVFHVGIGFAGPSTSVDIIQGAFPSGAGWARYASNCWIVTSYSPAKEISDKIRAVIRPQDSVFVCELNLGNHSGVLQQEIWNWINDNRAAPW